MTDDQLIERCRGNDRKAQNLLFKKYERKVLTICRRYTSSLDEARDVQQDAFVKIFKSIAANHIEIDSLPQWINRITVNIAIDSFRKQKRLEEVHQQVNSIETVNPEILDRLDQEQLVKLIQSIPIHYRTVFNLFIIEGYSHNEISEMLKIEESTSRSYLTRAKEFLKKKLSTT